jgi:hypothetical protein
MESDLLLLAGLTLSMMESGGLETSRYKFPARLPYCLTPRIMASLPQMGRGLTEISVLMPQVSLPKIFRPFFIASSAASHGIH